MTKLLSNKIKQRPLTPRGRTKTKQKNRWVGCFVVGFLLKMRFEVCSEQKVLPTNTSELELAQKDLWINRSNQQNQRLGLHLRRSSQILEDFTSQSSQSYSRFIHPGLSEMSLFSPQVFGSFLQDKTLPQNSTVPSSNQPPLFLKAEGERNTTFETRIGVKKCIHLSFLGRQKGGKFRRKVKGEGFSSVVFIES